MDFEDLVAALEALATDGSKHRARKDRAKQRSSFRDILHTVEVRKESWGCAVLCCAVYAHHDVGDLDFVHVCGDVGDVVM